MLLQGPRFRHWLPFPMILLWLFCVGVTGQDFCSSLGHLPAPKLFLTKTSAQEADTVLARCTELPNLHVTKVVFCKDGVDLSSQKFKPGKISYILLLNTSRRGAWSYSCGYQQKDEKNWVANSQLSAPLQLKVTDRKAPRAVSSVTDQTEKPPPHEGQAMSISIWILRSTLVLLLLVSAPIITFILERQNHRSA